MRNSVKLLSVILFLIIIASLGLAPVALASDHLFDAATSPGAFVRGFTVPVTLNPSGTSGAAAQPGTVPGEGNPNSGGDLGTPSVNCDLLNPAANPAFCD